MYIVTEGLSIPKPEIKDFCQLAAASPVAALPVHRTGIHYRDCASLTLYTRGPFWLLVGHFAVVLQVREVQLPESLKDGDGYGIA